MNTTTITDPSPAVKPRRITAAEPYPVAVVRLAVQALRAGVQAQPRSNHTELLEWTVTRQHGAAGRHLVTMSGDGAEWTCSECPAHTKGRLCAHLALCRADWGDCPACGNLLAVCVTTGGAVRCSACAFAAPLTPAEADGWSEVYLTCAQAPFLWLVAQRVGAFALQAVA